MGVMEVTEKQLLDMIAEYDSAYNQHLAGANACVGAKEVLQRLLTDLKSQNNEVLDNGK